MDDTNIAAAQQERQYRVAGKQRSYREIYNEDSIQKPINIVLSKSALANLEEKAGAMGIRRNELIRQVLYGVAFKETLAA